MKTNKPEALPIWKAEDAWADDVMVVRLSDYETLQSDRDQQYDMKVKAREQRDAVTAKLKALQAECDQLRKDAERLDWLADPENQIGEVLLPTEVVEQNPHSMRAAIDAAMEMKQ